MRSYVKNILAVGLSAIVVAGAIVPAEAMPLLMAPKSVETLGNDASKNIVNVQYWRDRDNRGGWGGERRGWYGGHRGYRDYRPGYRHHDGYWFPLAAFATGAIIGGALSQPREIYRPVPEYRPRPVYREYRPVRRAGMSQAHVNWCYGRYRSYDAYSNTFQPYNGPRQPCYSPYS